ncbi:MAG: tetratricopeptide repeat protein [Flavobacteriales bacterium]|nr:tetratricopeptide repeat protein [Flavobacteriales bacterium]
MPYLQRKQFAAVLLAATGCLLPAALPAQDASLVPGLRRTLAAAADDTARADALARICFNLIRSSPDSALLAGEQAMAIARRINEPKALGDAYNNLGWLAVEQGEFGKADTLLGKALQIFRKLGKPEYTAVTLSNLGWLAQKQGDAAGALRRFQSALQAGESVGDSASTASVLYAMGSTYRNLKEFGLAKEYLHRSLEMERALGRRGNEASCLLSLANTAREQGDTTGMMGLYREASALYSLQHDHRGGGLVEENIGDFLAEAAPREALRHYHSALAHYIAIDSPEDKAYVLKNIGMAETALGNLAEAEKNLMHGLGLAENLNSRELVMAYELALARLAAAQGNATSTMLHYDRYTALKDSLQGENTQHEIARLRTEFESERKDKDNALLRIENKAQEQQLRNREVQLLGIALLALLAMVAALLFRRNYRQKRKHADELEGFNARLEASHAEIREINGLLEMRLLRSQMNPHFIHNGLNSAARLTQEGRSAEALAYLQGFARMLRMVLEHSVRDRVGIQEEMDFLRQYLKLESHRLQGLSFSVKAERELIDDEAELPALLVQPFVENAVWHGLTAKEGERSVRVRFRQTNDGMQCEITDNGVGRKAAANLSRNGHVSLGMQLTGERLQLLARRLGDDRSVNINDLADEAGAPAGTRVTLLLPRQGKE